MRYHGLRLRPGASPVVTAFESNVVIVTFRTEAYSDITMFGDVAKKLLGMMGHSGTVPSAIAPEDIGDALARLKAAVGRDQDEPSPGAGHAEDAAEPVVSLGQRAYPLIQLLEAAARDECYVRWDSKWP